MKAAETLRGVMKSENVTFKALADMMGYKYYNMLQKRFLPNNDMRSAMLVRIADLMGYEVVIRKKDHTREFIIPVEETVTEE